MRRLPMNISSETMEVIENEYPSSTDTAALAERLGLTITQLHNIAHKMHIAKLPSAKFEIQSRISTVKCKQFMITY